MNDGKEFLVKAKEAHKGGWSNFFETYNIKNSFVKSITFKIAFLLTFVLQLVLTSSSIDPIIIIEDLVARNLNIIPNILGFAIASYAMLISGFSDRILYKIAKTKLKNNKLPQNSFQKTSATFGMAIFIMSTCLLINYLIQIILNSHFDVIIIPFIILNIINYLCIFFINITSLYALLLVFNIIINLFAFSQFLSAIITIEKKENHK